MSARGWSWSLMRSTSAYPADVILFDPWSPSPTSRWVKVTYYGHRHYRHLVLRLTPTGQARCVAASPSVLFHADAGGVNERVTLKAERLLAAIVRSCSLRGDANAFETEIA